MARYLLPFFIVSLVMGGFHYYVWARLFRDTAWPSLSPRAAGIVLGVLYALLMLGFISFRVHVLPRSVAPSLMWVVYIWLGIVFFLVTALAAMDVAKLVTMPILDRGARGPSDPERRLAITRMFAGAAALLGLGASGAGLVGGLSKVSIKRVKIAIDGLSKKAHGYRIVQISDVHVGPTIRKDFVEDIVARVNDLKPDMVVITGDLVDGSVEDLAEHVAPIGRLSAKDGVFFVTGNHEYYSGADEWIAHLRHALGIRVLRNEHVRIGGEHGFDLAGIDDASAHTRGHGADLPKALAGRDNSRPLVLLAHQPRGVDLAERLGVDLQLSGHTHGGQLFPWNFFVRLQQPFIAGLYKLTRAQIYVSRGTGYWGPPMRLAAPAEITEIELQGSA